MNDILFYSSAGVNTLEKAMKEYKLEGVFLSDRDNRIFMEKIKEIRMSPGIDVGDFNTKLKNAQKFLTEGNRVKVSVRFRGREMAHTEIGRELLKKFAEQCAEVATMDKAAKLEGRNMSMFLSPKTGK